MPDITEAIEQQQFLTFFLAGEEYAIGILRVKEIIEYETVTTVPRAPKWMRGVINLRGTVVPVADLALKLGLPASAITKTTCVIIVEVILGSQATTMGIIADAVNQVMDVLPEDIRLVPEFGTGIKPDYLLGVTQLGRKFVLLLDTDKVLTTHEVLNINEISTTSDNHGGLPQASPRS